MILEPSLECATPKRIRSLQDARLRSQQIRFAQVPAYRPLLRSPRDWSALRQSTLINGEAYGKSHSAFLKLSREGLAYVDITSGTTGPPKMRFVTDQDDAIDKRLLARSFCAFGIRKSDRVLFVDVGDLNLFAIGSKALSDLGNDRSVFHAVRLPFAKSFQEAFRVFNPDVLFTIPSVLMRGFDALREHLQGRSRLRSIIYTGEHLQDKIRHYLWKSHRVEVFSLYSSIELGFIGAECEQHDGDHLWADALLPHIAGATKVRQKVFKREANVLRGIFGATQLLHEGSPAFMYQTGDVVYFTDAPCACGRTLPRLKFLSRSKDIFSVYSSKLSFSQFHNIVYPNDEEDTTNLLQIVVTENKAGVLLTLILPVESLYSVEQRAAVIRCRLESDPSLAFLVEHGLLRFRLSFRPATFFVSRKVNTVEDRRIR